MQPGTMAKEKGRIVSRERQGFSIIEALKEI